MKPAGRGVLPIEDWRTVSDSVHRDGAGDDWVRIAASRATWTVPGSRTAFSSSRSRTPPVSCLMRQRNRICGPGSAPPIRPDCRPPCMRSAIGPTRLSSRSTTPWRGAHGARDRRTASNTRSICAPGYSAFGAQRVVASMQPYTRSTTAVAGETHRAGPHQDDLRFSHAAIPTHRWPLVRLDGRAPGSDLGVYAAVTRRTLDGKNPGWLVPEQKVSVGEALRAYHLRQRVGVVHGAEMGNARAESVCGRRGVGSRPVWRYHRLDRAVRVRYTISGGESSTRSRN